MHEFPDAEEGELREPCHNTVQEYEESIRVWEEMKDTGELSTSYTDSAEEDKLTGEDLLRTLDKTSAVTRTTASPKALLSHIDWPKRVFLRQTILVSQIFCFLTKEVSSKTMLRYL